MERGKGKILVVDDDVAVCTLIAKFLAKHGHQVIVATNPLHAIGLLDSQPIQLIITDLMMPQIDGLKFAEQIREKPRYKDTPIIMVTAYATDDVVERSMRSGIALTLPKPIDLDKLLNLVGFALQHSAGPAPASER